MTTYTAPSEVAQVTEAFFSFDFSWEELAYNLSALVVSFLLALPVGWDREQQRQNLGLRTFPLVAMGACAYVLVAKSIVGNSPDGMARMLQGVVTGIGFVGGGVILKTNDRVSGTATAASVWTMGALGAAVALRRLEIALLLAVVTFATLRWLRVLKSESDDD